MNRQRALCSVSLILLAVLLMGASCVRPGTPTPSTQNPAATVANVNNLLLESLKASLNSVIAARDAGQMTQADTVTAENVIEILTLTAKKVNVILRNGEAWDQQKLALIGLVAGVAGQEAVKKLPPTAAVIMATALGQWNAIAAMVGGPKI